LAGLVSREVLGGFSAAMVAAALVRPADSHRLGGENLDHVKALAEVRDCWPPIVVHRQTMRVIGGMHRLRAARLRGQPMVELQFFEGDDDDAFVAAVKANVAHGLPLTLADRRAAAARIVGSHAQRSDRWIGEVTGLAGGTVGAIRRRVSPSARPGTARIGRDGWVRPLEMAEGRRKAQEQITSRPEESLREIARTAGVSPATVKDVRDRMRRGENPVPRAANAARAGHPGQGRSHANGEDPGGARDLAWSLDQLSKDPSLRCTESGRALLRWLETHARGPRPAAGLIDTVPSHCGYLIADIARKCAREWQELATALEQRLRTGAPQADRNTPSWTATPRRPTVLICAIEQCSPPERRIVKRKLKKIQYRSHLIDDCLAGTGLKSDPGDHMDTTSSTWLVRRENGVGVMVRERRVRAGLTQRELAAVAGVSIGALRDLEQGRTRFPRWGTVDAIAVAFGMDQYQRAALASAWSGVQPDDHPGSGATQAEPQRSRAGVRIGVLGPLTVTRYRMDLNLGCSSRRQALLGLLALYWPAGVPLDVIVDVLWGERPPRSAVTEVQAQVSRLRRLLDPGRPPRACDAAVALTGNGYRLSDRVAVDAEEFRLLSRHADAAAARGELRLASVLYDRSLGLWRGRVLAGIDLLQGLPAATEAARRWAEVIQRLARIAVADGRFEAVLPHLQKLCASEPFNEQAHALLMTALAATGQQAAALQLFGEIRCRLDRELGIRPCPMLVATHVRILRQQLG